MITGDPDRFAGSLEGKTVVVAATASISIYRLPDIIRDLRREGARVIVGMSPEAVSLISPEVMKWACEDEVITRITGEIEHISRFIGDRKDTMLLACPASYNLIGKMASGISDDVPSLFFSFALGNGNPVVVSPVMHEGMMVNPINQENLRKLEKAGVSIIPPRVEESKAKISGNDSIVDYVSRGFNHGPLDGRSVLIVGGRGEERVDPVRTITNSGTGLTAVWMARNAFRLGASRIAMVGNSQYPVPGYVEMHHAGFMGEYEESVASLLKGEKFDCVINLASLSDFRVREEFNEKLDSGSGIEIHLEPRKKLNRLMREHYQGHLVVFKLSRSATPDSLRQAFREVKPDMIVFNPYDGGKTPFGPVESRYMAVMAESHEELGVLSKPAMTARVLEIMAQRMGKHQ